jgi:hypothetical protein
MLLNLLTVSTIRTSGVLFSIKDTVAFILQCVETQVTGMAPFSQQTKPLIFHLKVNSYEQVLIRVTSVILVLVILVLVLSVLDGFVFRNM